VLKQRLEKRKRRSHDSRLFSLTIRSRIEENFLAVKALEPRGILFRTFPKIGPGLMEEKSINLLREEGASGIPD
jgi:hypothetical protein